MVWLSLLSDVSAAPRDDDSWSSSADPLKSESGSTVVCAEAGGCSTFIPVTERLCVVLFEAADEKAAAVTDVEDDNKGDETVVEATCTDVSPPNGRSIFDKYCRLVFRQRAAGYEYICPSRNPGIRWRRSMNREQ